ncbi:hypothetical protein [Pseudoflavonifractor capillosus]|uniref:Uncharacterized protein n=1 Tax=Pseudoflavonifractor capillosus TaxID=106588 RepID=A0A921MKA5_9FIRM|nr:hypothetical protein [Pseudoflavonifractor capillosus]HJG86024.1 hypothetical protein [Pseudoflavonifractor capillosus]
MSCVYLLAASHPLPLYDSGLRRLRTVKAGITVATVEEDGFSVMEHSYYRHAVDDLGLDMQPCRYELNLAPTEEDAALLRAYLEQACAHGETVELWHLWVGGEAHRVRRFSGPLSALERDTLEQLAEHPQACLTITI